MVLSDRAVQIDRLLIRAFAASRLPDCTPDPGRNYRAYEQQSQQGPEPDRGQEQER
jgi:hypothetical protein